MCFDANGDILVADTYNARLVRYDTTGVVLGTVDLSETPVTEPLDVYQDGFGTTYVLGQSPTSAQFIRLNADGNLVGTYPNPAEGSIYYPTKLSVDTWGNLWVNTQPISGSTGVQRWTFQEGNPDHTAPITTDDAPATWQTSAVSVTLSATDQGKSGVDATYYSLDGTVPTLRATGPISVSSEGTTTLKYFSVDKAGNAESVVTRTVLIDRLAPITLSNAVPMYYGEAVIDLTVLEAGSGVQHTQWSLDQGSTWYSGTRIVIPATSYGLYELLWRSFDNAGNIEDTKSFLFNVNTTADEDDPKIVYKGAWSSVSDGIARNAKYTASQSTSATAYFVFKGRNIDLYGRKGPDMGKFTITLNGQNPSTIDCYSATPQRAFLTSWGGLNPTTANVLAVTPLGTHNPASTGDSVGIDYVDIAGTLEFDSAAPCLDERRGDELVRPEQADLDLRHRRDVRRSDTVLGQRRGGADLYSAVHRLLQRNGDDPVRKHGRCGQQRNQPDGPDPL